MKGVFVVIPCGQAKIWDKQPWRGPMPARDAYIGAPFKVNLQYAEHFADEWVILSAKYGFIAPDFVICCRYDVSFKKPATNPISLSILKKQAESLTLDRFHIIVGLGGKEYQAAIKAALPDHANKLCFPFAGLPLGKGMQAIKQAIAACVPY
jgi:hypothetical protein